MLQRTLSLLTVATFTSSFTLTFIFTFIFTCFFAFTFSASAQQTHSILVNSDGTFEGISFQNWPLVISSGDTVEWQFTDSGQSIIQLRDPTPGAETCAAPAAWDPDTENAFTGPMPRAPSGISVLAPIDRSHSVFVRGAEPAGCYVDPLTAPANMPTPVNFIHDGEILCRDDNAVRHRVLDEVLENPAVSIIYLRFDWNQIETAPDTFEFGQVPNTSPPQYEPGSLLGEIDRIVRAGKLYSLSIRAGHHGTPDWLAEALHMPHYQFMDGGSKIEPPACGTAMTLPDPTDPAYGQRYGQMLRRVAEELQKNAAHWRGLAYIKPSGANLFTSENRLPMRCVADCPICNTEVWARAGYTPEGLYDFYDHQLRTIARYFPDKSMSYELIQDGFPLVSDADHYKGCLAPGCEGETLMSSPVPSPVPMPSSVSFLPDTAEQTTEILMRAAAAHPEDFVVMHAGLGLFPGRGVCPNEGIHPADNDPADGRLPEIEDFAAAGSGCPNRWVLYHSARGQFTGYQTPNTHLINQSEHVESALFNMERNSDGMFLEIYEQLAWLIGRQGGVLTESRPRSRSLEEWAEVLHERRRDNATYGTPSLPDPYPNSYSYTFSNSGGTELNYVFTDLSSCVEPAPNSPDTFGEIVVQP